MMLLMSKEPPHIERKELAQLLGMSPAQVGYQEKGLGLVGLRVNLRTRCVRYHRTPVFRELQKRGIVLPKETP